MFSIRLVRAEVWNIPHPTKHRHLKRRPAGRGCRAGLPAIGQPAAWLSAVPVSLVFQHSFKRPTGFNSSVFLKWLSWPPGISELIRESQETAFPVWSLWGFISSPVLIGEKKEIHPFTFEPHSHFHLQWQLLNVNWIHFPWRSFARILRLSPLTKKKKRNCRKLGLRLPHSPGPPISVPCSRFFVTSPTWQLHLVLMWPSHGLAVSIPCSFTVNQMHHYELCMHFRADPIPGLIWKWFFFFSLTFGNESHICCGDEWQGQSDILCVCLAQKSTTLNYRLVSDVQVALAFPGDYYYYLWAATVTASRLKLGRGKTDKAQSRLPRGLSSSFWLGRF